MKYIESFLFYFLGDDVDIGIVLTTEATSPFIHQKFDLKLRDMLILMAAC